MGSKLLLLLALVAAGVLAFVVITSMSDDPVGSGPRHAVKPEEEDDAIVAPPPLPDDPAGKETVGESATLSILVTDEEQRPIPGARIVTNIDKLPAGRREAITGPDGRAIIEGLPGGKRVSVQAKGELTRIPGTRVVELEAGATAEAHIVLKEGGAVTGTVLGPGGAPVGVPYRVEVVAAIPGAVPRPAGMPRGMIFGGRRQAGRDFGADQRIFTIGGLKPGRYMARGSAEGYLGAQSEAFEIVKGSIRDGVVITLDRGGRVSGVVVRGRTGEPVAEARVSLTPSGMITLGGAGGRIVRAGGKGAETDELGRFSIEGVAPGTYTVTAGAKELASGRAENVKVEKGRDAEGVMIMLGEGGAITGTVFGQDGRPVPNASVQISRLNTGVQVFGSFGGNVKADGKGVFHRDHLEPGRYRVRLATGGITASASVTIVMSGLAGEPPEKPKEKPLGPDEVMVFEGQVVRHDLLSPLLCSISGTVTDDGGEPMKGRVQLDPLEIDEAPREEGEIRIRVPRFANANARGEFKFAGLLPGRYALRVIGAREEVTLIPGAEAEVTIIVRPARLEGAVYGADGRPVKGAMVTLRPLGRSAGPGNVFRLPAGGRVRTDEQGRFVMERITAARYRLMATIGQQRGESTEFEVGPGGVRKNIRIDLE